ncbi:tetratricopeptide repeat protein [Actinoplanes sp. NPDC049118]|uniref:tetratricopeptide repeat protein n=1 Tax=Actinoplanes sp. NPDC049118 TaxID=3155769 RepID=UPI003403BBED
MARTTADRAAALQLLRLCAHFGPGELDLDLLLSDPELFARLMPDLTRAAGDPRRREAAIAGLAVGWRGSGNRVRLDPDAAREALDDLARPGRMGWWWAHSAVQLLDRLFPVSYGTPRELAVCADLAPHVHPAVDRAPGAPNSAALLIKLGYYLERHGEYEACRDNQVRALPIVAATYGPGSSSMAGVLFILGCCQLSLGDWRAARSGFEQAVQIYRGVAGPDSLDVAEALYLLGTAQAGLGERGAARFSRVEALRILEAGAAPDDPRTEIVREALRPAPSRWRMFG